jgi:hypothetical protein
LEDSAGNKIFNFTYNSYLGSPAINGEAVSLTTANSNTYGVSNYTTTNWLTFEAVVDFTVSPATVDLVVKDGSSKVYDERTTTTATNINKLFGSIGRSNGAFAYDNIVINELTKPAFTLDSNDASISSTQGASVGISGITGTISVESSDTDVATAVYNETDGTIDISYVGDGAADITVTATNDGLTVSDTIDVTAGDVTVYDVTVNVYKTGTTTAIDGRSSATITNKVKDATVTADEINTALGIADYTAQFTNSTAKYTYNGTASTDLAVFEVSDTAENNVINIYYDEALAVTSATISYTYNGSEIATRNVSVSGYVGDIATIVDVFYVNGTDGVIYKTGNELYTTNAVSANTAATTAYDRAVTLGTTLEVPVTVSDKAVFFVEGENMGVGSTEPDNNRKANLTCSGNLASGAGTASSSVNVYTAPHTGTYQIVVVNFARNRNSLLKAGDTELATIGNYNNNYRGQYTVLTTDLTEGTVITYNAANGNALTEVDYILIRDLTPTITLASATATSSVVSNADGVAKKVGEETTTVDVNGQTVYTIWYKVSNTTAAPKFTLKKGTKVVGEDLAITKATAATSGDNTGFYCVQVLKNDKLEAGDYTATISVDGAESKSAAFTVE